MTKVKRTTTNSTESQIEMAKYKDYAKIMQTGTPSQASNAFTEIYARYKEWIHFFVLGSVNSDIEVAKDLTQEIFIKVFKSIDSYSAEFALSTWIHKIALNSIIDHKRKSNVELLSIEALQTDYSASNDDNSGSALFQIKDESADTHNSYMKLERKELVHKAISSIISNEKERIVIDLFFMKGLSQEEIQAETNLAVGTIKTLVFRAKDKLKSFLTAQSPDLLLMDRYYNKKIKAIN